MVSILSSITAADAVEHWSGLALYATAATALGYALQIHNPESDPWAMVWLTVAVILSLVGLVLPGFSWLEKFKERPVLILLTLAFAFQLWQLLTTTASLTTTHTGILVAISSGVLLSIVFTKSVRLARRILLPVFLAAHFCCGVSIIRQTPEPYIDVYFFHHQAIESVLHGANPYGGTIPNIYQNTDFYGPGIVRDGRVQVGFPYPPLSLLFALAGHLIAGDYRYSLLVAMTFTGVLLAYARPGMMGTLAALVFLTTPRIFYLLELGWTDPYAVMLLAATVFCACRAPKRLPWVLGLLFAIKQYTFLVLPFVFFLLPQPVHWRVFARLVVKAMVLAAALTLPMMFWNLPGFLNDVVYFQFRQPFRIDSLSYQAWLARADKMRLPNWFGFVGVFPPIAVALWRTVRTPTGFAAAVASVYIVFFALSKQAFANYYMFVIGALCCALAAKSPHTSQEEPRSQYVDRSSP